MTKTFIGKQPEIFQGKGGFIRINNNHPISYPAYINNFIYRYISQGNSYSF